MCLLALLSYVRAVTVKARRTMRIERQLAVAKQKLLCHGVAAAHELDHGRNSFGGPAHALLLLVLPVHHSSCASAFHDPSIRFHSSFNSTAKMVEYLVNSRPQGPGCKSV